MFDWKKFLKPFNIARKTELSLVWKKDLAINNQRCWYAIKPDQTLNFKC